MTRSSRLRRAFGVPMPIWLLGLLSGGMIAACNDVDGLPPNGLANNYVILAVLQLIVAVLLVAAVAGEVRHRRVNKADELALTREEGIGHLGVEVPHVVRTSVLALILLSASACILGLRIVQGTQWLPALLTVLMGGVASAATLYIIAWIASRPREQQKGI
ncbi:hypothetical protein JNJ66_05400 [Candidatus Saccharibacteria bacterium]|nr:hypothetical protein [Candidatus Saccharibacteria bacterium]